MGSFARRWSPAAAWSVDDASTFAAQKEFKLLQLLSNDKKALATARRLGLFCQKPQPQGQASAAHTGAGISRASNADAASAPAGPTRKQKKSRTSPTESPPSDMSVVHADAAAAESSTSARRDDVSADEALEDTAARRSQCTLPPAHKLQGPDVHTSLQGVFDWKSGVGHALALRPASRLRSTTVPRSLENARVPKRVMAARTTPPIPVFMAPAP